MISVNTSVNLVLPVGTGEESGVNSTSTFFINGVRHVGNVEELVILITAARCEITNFKRSLL
jgi:hypothetical protein